MNCNKCKQMLLSYLDNELNPLEIVSIEDHLSACSGCSEDLEALAQTQGELRQAFKSMTTGVSPSPHALASIRQRIAADKGHSAGILNRWKEMLLGGTTMFKSPNFRWQMVGTLMAGVLLIISLTIPSWSDESPSTAAANGLTKFSSYDELKEFIGESSQSYYQLEGDDVLSFGGGPFITFANASTAFEESASRDFSITNIQVEGVDEADIVKTDGDFIYLVSDSRVIIVKADPEDAKVLAEIDQEEDINITGLFINGDKLAVIYQNWNYREVYYEYDENNEKLSAPESYRIYQPQTFISVYNISDREDPVLTRDLSIDGDYFDSRMIGDYIYLIANASAYEQNEEIELPVIHLDNTNTEDDIEIQATDIYYTDIADNYYNFTTITAVDVKDDDEEPEHETVLLGTTSNLYVSLNNIYIASTNWSDNSEKTALHRIHISDGDIEYEASGEAPGRLLNQFSMDEYGDFFRIATTMGNISRSFEDATSLNHLYVLDMDLNVTGKVENLAPGEEIYSTRFMGDKAYIVTFRKVDPLFVLDLSNPHDPEVLGQLKITGYSDYLHPYDDDHLIGIGKETIAAEEGDFAWYQGVKISLFDVSDVEEPEELAKYEIGDRGTDSPVLEDHKALLFDKTKNLLVIPVWLAEINEAQYPYSEVPPNAYGEIVWQGAYVFDISIEGGLQLKGRITHYDDPSQAAGSYYGNETIQRSLYIDDVLYTISDAKIGMNDLETLEEIGEIILP